MATWRWEFYDPILVETHTLAINPSEVQGPKKKKTITRRATTAPQGRTILFEGQDEPESMRWTGVLRSQAQFDAFDTWFDKRHQIRVTDHLERQFWVYIEEFDPTLLNRVNEPWAHKYTIAVVILNWET